MALFRALESARPQRRRLFRDPYAADFLRPSFRALVRLSRLPLVGSIVDFLVDLNAPGARSSGTARTRLIDDLLAETLREGFNQVVILGAGFDCRAIRLPEVDKGRVFELDHPDTLAVKKERIIRELGSLPKHVEFIEVDFDRQPAELALQGSIFDWSSRAFVIWEGVTNYLSATAVDATFNLIATMAAQTRIVFTYVHSAALTGSAEFKGMARLSRRLLRMGEPWTFGFDPGELPAYLAVRGLELIEDIGSVEYRRRYMHPRGRHMTGYEFYRAAVARVLAKPGQETATGAPLRRGFGDGGSTCRR